jgi:hypothetical protein
MHTALRIHSLHRRVGRRARHQLPLHFLLRGPLAIGPLRPTTHLSGQSLLFFRIRHRRPRRSGTSLVFPRPRTSLYAPTSRAQGSQAHHDRTIRDRPTPGVPVWDAERARDVARNCQPRLVYAALWLARDDIWEARDWGMGDAERVGVGA